jgi:hypothetical protein
LQTKVVYTYLLDIDCFYLHLSMFIKCIGYADDRVICEQCVGMDVEYTRYEILTTRSQISVGE